MYTSLSPNNERFGFYMTGKFKCAYKLERTLIIAGLIPLGVLLVLLIISLVAFLDLFDSTGAIKGGLVNIEVVPGSANGVVVNMAPGMMSYSVSIFTLEFFGIMFGALALLYFLVVVILRAGRKYGFTANENGMTIHFPKGYEESFLYKDVLAVLYEERKFMYGSRGLDITIKTRYKSYTYHLIHTPLSKVNGIYETPFNIVRERAELSSKFEDITKYGRGV